MGMGRGCRHRGRERIGRGAALVPGAVAFLLQVLAFFWMPALAPASVGLVPICTPAGVEYRAVSADTGGPASETPAKAKHGCPLCPLMAGLHTPPGGIGVPAPAVVAAPGSLVLAGAQVAAGWFLATVQARAPPALA